MLADWAGSGAGTGNPDFTARLSEGDQSSDDQMSPCNVINGAYWAPGHRESPEMEQMLLEEVLLALIGDHGYPGDSTPSDNWPGVAPGTRGILNALSGKYCNWSGIVEIDLKPPILWTHGSADIVVADGSLLEMGTLGQAGLVPGWPGEEVFPPQQMVSQIRDVLESYVASGGRMQFETFEGSGHGPHFDAADRWSEVFFEFLTSVE